MAVSLIAPKTSSLIQNVASSFINVITGKGQEDEFLPFSVSIACNDESSGRRTQKICR